ncbi:cysteine hydrolase [Stenotrophomonas maltophilia]|uniref:cysteine hydrolase family protein n=1 Tax=Stenotrophomonas maltophilia TaxID=40324 RepID=UPI000D4662F6|nr:cysteine hydrolase [Stenotrophomonas maltophilia]MBA0388782.1 cysteine hydrolase [Stenotrophomonas maltophilia]MBA0392512.1 cysteine hydrolase [Stenotrophomonas maltophilia]MBA0464986.1 cysteine hydrolase [Stenotrophomonas maltophilia]MBA0473419.1 cysteine hydrolase [Stenotrophomonas maltophilia]MCF3480011.1 isochorismatase family protein [Stenotrophomonas maltophilia]
MNLTAFGLASLIGMTATLPVAAAEPAHPTIRHMAGAPVATSLDAAKTAVLVIDFQNEYFDAKAVPGFAGGRMVIPDGVAALRQARRVVEFADAHGIRVIHVQHVLPAGAPLFAQGSVNAAFHRDLQPRQGETVVQKDNVSVFAGASAAVLDPMLKNAGIDTLIVTGLQTHACVAGAARDAAAAPRGYRVIVSSDASASRDLDLAGGRRIDHRALHEASLAQIEDAFGDVMSTDAILALPVRKAGDGA